MKSWRGDDFNWCQEDVSFVRGLGKGEGAGDVGSAASLFGYLTLI